MKTGLNLLKSRTLKEKVDFLKIEERYGITIPPLFRVFFESYDWDTSLVEAKEFHFYPELEGGEITFPFNSLEDHLLATVNSSDEEILSRKLIVLATGRFGFYVGTLGEDKDKVLTRTASTENSFKVVSNDIFEFLRGVTDNLSDAASTVEEYRQFMIALGYDDDEVEEEIEDWKNYKGIS